MFLNKPKKCPSIWATFERRFVTKTFQKSPNLVTLDKVPSSKLGFKASPSYLGSVKYRPL